MTNEKPKMTLLQKKKKAMLIKKTREKYGSVSHLCNQLGITRQAFYLAVSLDPYMRKLLSQIFFLLSDQVEVGKKIPSEVTIEEKRMLSACYTHKGGDDE